MAYAHRGRPSDPFDSWPTVVVAPQSDFRSSLTARREFGLSTAECVRLRLPSAGVGP
jgi:hypothetical protein